MAIVMRTKDRPVLLARALASVLSQSCTDWTLQLVNDGGGRRVLDRTLAPFRDAFADRLVVVHHETSLGMEAASNRAISNSRSIYVVVHDDDDSWDPDFLLETTGFLDNPENRMFGGVVTWSELVLEQIEGRSIRPLGRSPYNCWYRSIDFHRLLGGNVFAPISFLFRRDILNAAGLYDENLPVLGDWEFNVRFLLKSDIAVLPKILAYYHQRPISSPGSPDSNSVHAESDAHVRMNTILRNRYLREHLSKVPQELGGLSAGSYRMTEIIDRLNGVESFLSSRTAQSIERHNQVETFLADLAARHAMQQHGRFDTLETLLAGARDQIGHQESIRNDRIERQIAEVQRHIRELNAKTEALLSVQQNQGLRQRLRRWMGRFRGSGQP